MTENYTPIEQRLRARADAAALRDLDRRLEADPDMTFAQYWDEYFPLLGCTWTTECQDDDCDSSFYTPMQWAYGAIDGRQYKRRRGPDIRWAFRMADGKVLEVRPLYITLEEHRRVYKHLDLEESPLLSDSNWQFADRFLLALYTDPKQRRPFAEGWFESWDGPLVTTGDQSLTDAVNAKLWDVHRNKAAAFAGMPVCGMCRRELTDETSVRMGIGPDCAHRLGISHGVVNARIGELRREQQGAC